jgi:sterol desaturase/sphingolipid hydroxylase (fatty acid hydroxylase superfamily)
MGPIVRCAAHRAQPGREWRVAPCAVLLARPVAALAALTALLRARQVGMGWYGYWHVSLYTWGWGERKFNGKNEGPSRPRLFHNIWYCLLGMLQWTAWELAFVYMFATNKAPYMPDDELFASAANFLPTFCWVLALPVFRDFHFYFAHRLIHVRSLCECTRHRLHPPCTNRALNIPRLAAHRP